MSTFTYVRAALSRPPGLNESSSPARGERDVAQMRWVEHHLSQIALHTVPIHHGKHGGKNACPTRYHHRREMRRI